MRGKDEKLIVSVLVVFTSSAQAEPEWFLGASGGRSIFSKQASDVARTVGTTVNQAIIDAGADVVTTTTTVSQERADSGYKVFGGGWLTPNVGFEIGYVNFGKTKFDIATRSNFEVGGNDFDVDSDSSSDVKATTFYIAGLLAHQFENKSRIFGKLGVYQAKTKLSGSGVVTSADLPDVRAPFRLSDDNTSSNMMFGVGYTLPLSNSVDLRAEYERFNKVDGGDVGKTSIDFTSIGISVRF